MRRSDTSREELKPIIESVHSKSEACRQLGWSINGGSFRMLNKLADEHDIEFKSLDPQKYARKYKRKKKSCPVCEKEFYALIGSPSHDKKTCSHSCANVYFRSGKNNGFYRDGSSTAKKAVLKKSPFCIDCGESRPYLLRVHHMDGDRNNNDQDNYEVVCCNHHAKRHLKLDTNTGEWVFCTSSLTPRDVLPSLV